METRPVHLRPRSGPRPTPRSRPHPWLWILVLIPLLLIAAVSAVIGLGALFNLTGTSVALAAGERDLVLDIAHLTGWMSEYTPDPAAESVSKTRYIDDSYEIEYVYDVPADDDAPYLSYTVTFEPTAGDATTTYVSLWGGTKVGFYVFGEVQVEVQEKNDLYQWGDESRMGLLLANGQPFGNVFVARKGKRVVYLLVSGVYFDDKESLTELLSPYMERLEAFESDG